jgi:endoribonuclease L-PSP, putative
MTLTHILTHRAPPPMGPYSQAVRFGDMIFVSGQLPLDKDGNLIGPGDIQIQTKTVLESLNTILEEAGSSLKKVVKTTIFLANLDDFAAMNEVYARLLSSPYPARSTVEVSRFPGQVLIEIDCIAFA